METEAATADELDTMNSLNTLCEPTEKIGFGLILKKTRESANLTEKEVATRLYLNPSLIQMMENEDFENAPPATFICGYLRSYARLLSIPENDIKAALKELEKRIQPNPVAETIALRPRTVEKNLNRYVSWFSYLIVLTLITLVSIWWISHSREAAMDLPVKIAEPAVMNQPGAQQIAPPAANTAPLAEANTSVAPAPAANTAATPIETPTPPTTNTAPAESAPAAPPAKAAESNPPSISDMAVSLPEPGLESD